MVGIVKGDQKVLCEDGAVVDEGIMDGRADGLFERVKLAGGARDIRVAGVKEGKNDQRCCV